MENPKPQRNEVLTKKSKKIWIHKIMERKNQKGTSEGSAENITFDKYIGWLSRKRKDEEKYLQR